MPKNLEALARFAHLLATAPTSNEVKELLVESAVGTVGADAAVLVEIGPHGSPVMVARRAFDVAVALAPDDLGDELAERLRAASGAAFTSASSLPLVASGGLYGVLVLFFAEERQLDENALKLAGVFGDMVAATLARAQEVEELERAYEELKGSRRALAQAEKLRALGGMAAGISHDLKNVFGPLLMALDVLKRSRDDADTLRARCDMLRKPLENGLAIVDRLRVFSKGVGGEERELTRIDGIVDDAVDLCRPRIQPGTPLTIVVEKQEAPPVRLEVANAVASVTNLVVNALDALGAAGGTVTVRCGGREGGAVIEVQDSGPGVPQELRERIFDQFFTTKGQSGTGLGLALVKDFAQRHGGEVSLESPPSGGALFRLWLPASA